MPVNPLAGRADLVVPRVLRLDIDLDDLTVESWMLVKYIERQLSGDGSPLDRDTKAATVAVMYDSNGDPNYTSARRT